MVTYFSITSLFEQQLTGTKNSRELTQTSLRTSEPYLIRNVSFLTIFE